MMIRTVTMAAVPGLLARGGSVRPPRRRRRGAVALAVAVGVLALGGAASPAFADTLDISGPTSAHVGESVVYQVTGTGGAPDSYDMSWISVFAIPKSAVSECPGDEHSGSQLGYQTGAALTASMRPNKDSSGAFHNQVGAIAHTAETDLICAYTSDEVGYTKSRASTTLTIVDAGEKAPPATGGGKPQGAKPQNTQRPLVKRSGKLLTCAAGSWTSASKYSYSWRVKGKKAVKGRRLRITREVRGRSVQCVVRASNGSGASTAVSKAIRAH